MSVLQVEAAIECEGCGAHFRVKVETGGNIPRGWDMMDVVKNAVRGGHTITPKGQVVDLAASCSVQDDKMLCPKCTRETDAENTEEDEDEQDS
jgi:hypothetical protein